MATEHGAKIYSQVLTDPNRYELLRKEAERLGIRPTAWMRDAIYQRLEKDMPVSIYKEAEAADKAIWQRSVRRRVEGRMKPKDSPRNPSNAA